MIKCIIIFNDANVNTKYDNVIKWKNYLMNSLYFHLFIFIIVSVRLKTQDRFAKRK
jgi:hypothetical protein